MTAGDDEAATQRAADARLWALEMHEKAVFYQVGNLFLLAQSLLIVAFTSALTNAESTRAALMLHVIAVFGLVTSLAWAYMAHRQLKFNRRLQHRVRLRFPDYAETLDDVRSPGLRSKVMVVYLLPLVATSTWCVFLALA
ncbi:hypothetical protein ACFRDV_24910 [Streptomyces fagopyri]